MSTETAARLEGVTKRYGPVTALEHQPDVALLDIEMPGMDGLAAAAALRQALPGCRTLVLTTFGRPGYLRRAMDLGVYGFLVNDSPAGELAAAIRRRPAHRRPGPGRRRSGRGHQSLVRA
jgi:DNA-binding NarL/FixJ family response regulator